MATYNHKIRIANGDSTDIYHPETNSAQVYDFNNSAWVSSLIGTLSSLTTIQKSSLVESINEIAGTKASTTALTAHASAIATTSLLGHVKPDGRTITIDNNGVISSVGGSSTPPPPPPITDFTLSIIHQKMTLTWNNPTDDNFYGVKIQRKVNSMPQNSFDGETVYEGNSDTIYVDSISERDVLYYYRAFTFNASLSTNNDESQVVYGSSIVERIYTVVIDSTNPNPLTALTYADDAVGMVAGGAAWDELYPFNQIRPAMFLNGAVNFYLNPNNYAQRATGEAVNITDGTLGDVMVQFPKVYTYIRYVDHLLYVSLATGKIDSNDEFYKCIAHTKFDVEKDHFYVGAYNGTLDFPNLRSLSSNIFSGGFTISAFRDFAVNNGAGYQLYSYYQHLLIQVLYVIKYKNLNSQETIGIGYISTSDSAPIDSGTMDADGMTSGNTTSGSVGIKLFGIENLWGNVFQFIDGIMITSDRNLATSLTNDNFNDDGTNYFVFGQVDTFTDYANSAVGTTELGFLPYQYTGVGSSSTYYSDLVNTLNNSPDESHVLSVGAEWMIDGDAANVGIFCVDFFHPVTGTFIGLGARLAFL